jgi:argininosuccinate lyase
MPQKKNALVLEYLRSRTARTTGSLASVFAVSHNVGYMDTEEVELECYLPLFECFTNTEQSLPTIAQIVRDMVPDRELMYARAAGGFSSVTALAEVIQNTQGVSYRAAHRVVARSVLLAVEEGKTANQIGAAIVNRAAQEMIGRTLSLDDETIHSCLVPRSFVEHHAGIGATAPDEVRRMAAERQHRLGVDREKVEARERAVREGERMLSEAVGEIVAA